MNLPDQKLAEQLKTLYSQKEYERLLYLCRSIPPDNANYRSALFYAKKARFFLSNSDVKWAVAFLCVAISIMLSGVIYVNRKVDREFALKEMQVSSLINELGSLREANFFLQSQIAQKSEDLNLALNSLQDLEQKISVSAEEGKAGSREQIRSGQNISVAPTKLNLAGVDEEYLQKHLQTFLILGTHGSLTDTILVVVVNREKGEISLFSLPRDLYFQGRKINAVYNSYGAHQLNLYMEHITGLPMENFFVVNLQGFIEIIDLFGGIDINNDKAIKDAFYPGPNYTYSAFTLAAGEHHLDGETALKYARSRKSTSDFDRSRRQQKVIAAFLSKIKNYDFVANINRVQEIYSLLAANITTNIAVSEGVGWLNEFKHFEIRHGFTVDSSNYLYPAENVQDQYLLLPKKKDYSEVRAFIKDIVLN